jgi:hypothetical protein
MRHASDKRNASAWTIMRNPRTVLVPGACAALLTVAGGCRTASTTGPEAPGGGRDYVLNFNTFASTVDPILTARGCDNTNCHGGGIRGTFELSPDSDKDVDLDFSQARLQVNGSDPADSPILLKPLATECGGLAHGGGSFFASPDDPDYQTILAWIEAGYYR